MISISVTRPWTVWGSVAGMVVLLMRPAPAVAASDTRAFSGMCDASAVETLNDREFVVANDEDNQLRVYDWTRPGWPVRALNLDRFWPPQGSRPEMDLEGVARLGPSLFWISSHGRDAKGRAAPGRHALLRIPLDWLQTGAPLSGAPGRYTDLFEALARDPRYAKLRLDQAAARAPKAPGGLNIEALAATPQGALLIGFRSPLFEGRALFVPLLNPHALLDGAEAPRFGEPIFLALGGLGLRGAVEWERGYLLLAGSTDGGGRSRLFAWSGQPNQEPQEVASDALEGLNPEGLAFWPGTEPRRLLVVSDDGSRRLHDRDCKDLPAPHQKYRAITLLAQAP